MLLYLSRRFFQTLFILFILSIVIYYMLGLMPGDPVELLITANPKIKAEDIARLKKYMASINPFMSDILNG